MHDGAKIRVMEFIYSSASRQRFNSNGLNTDQPDYFDFAGPTFAPVPLAGSFVRWMYGRFLA